MKAHKLALAVALAALVGVGAGCKLGGDTEAYEGVKVGKTCEQAYELEANRVKCRNAEGRGGHGK